MKWFFSRGRPHGKERKRPRLLCGVFANLTFARQHLCGLRIAHKKGGRLNGAAVTAAEHTVERKINAAKLLTRYSELCATFVRQLALCAALS